MGNRERWKDPSPGTRADDERGVRPRSASERAILYDPVRPNVPPIGSLGLFDDITVEREDGPRGESSHRQGQGASEPRVGFVSGQQGSTRTTIEEGLKDKKIVLDVGKPLNLKSVADAENEIRLMLGQKGFLDPKSDTRSTLRRNRRSPSRSRSIPEARRGSKRSRSQGTRSTSRKNLTRLQLTDTYHWWKFWSQKSLYHPAKWDQTRVTFATCTSTAGISTSTCVRRSSSSRRFTSGSRRKRSRTPPRVRPP